MGKTRALCCGLAMLLGCGTGEGAGAGTAVTQRPSVDAAMNSDAAAAPNAPPAQDSGSEANAVAPNAEPDSGEEANPPPGVDASPTPADDAAVPRGPPCGDFASAVCPPTLPREGDRCPAFDLHCEYGPASTPYIWNASAVCARDCAWYPIAAWPLGYTAGPGCPGTFASVPVGASCTLDSKSNGCTYAEGWCYCASGSDGGVIWHCTKPPPACPVPRPLLGAPCTMEGLNCSYTNTCAIPGPVAVVCVQGHWQGGSVPTCG
jgi:hypothetical protein